ncbi:ECF transporter S component [Candidatus Enterococcus ferrettii]|uniref:Energy-coupling factor transport system substrate-specific component n=1 Tax=Candidatus Enterococcus ferrettii TaxID=2815324 RepID=A0ABV0EV03_9ENTE|nr:ECF transporter S component [Enterococcus sp. 665A]MBO1341665.1 ECF transporter S component [Enterococcus sp. 665A]
MKKYFQAFLHKNFSTKALVLIPIAVGINLVGGTLCSALKLPLFLDMIGTVLVACLAGPWVAALCGLITNLFLAIVTNPIFFSYALVSVLCGVVTGYLVMAGFFKNIAGAICTWLACTLTNSFASSLITIFVYGGATGVNASSLATAALIAATKEIVLSVFSTSLIENLVDKGLVFLIVYWLVKKIPKRFSSQYAPLDNASLINERAKNRG